jgi:hypothetical protein
MAFRTKRYAASRRSVSLVRHGLYPSRLFRLKILFNLW